MNSSDGKVLLPEQQKSQALMAQAVKDIRPLEQQLKNLRRDQGFAFDFTPPGMPKQSGPGINDEKARELTAAIEQIRTEVSHKIEQLTANLPQAAKEETRGTLSKWLYPHGSNEIVEAARQKQPDEAFKFAFITRYDKRAAGEIERSLPKDIDGSQEMLLDTLRATREVRPQKWDIDMVQHAFLASTVTFTSKLNQQKGAAGRQDASDSTRMNHETKNSVPEVLKQGAAARQKAWQELQAEHKAIRDYYQKHIEDPLPPATEKRMAKQVIAFEQKWDGKIPEKPLSEIKTLSEAERKNEFFSARDMNRAHNIIEVHYGHPENVPKSAHERMWIEEKEFLKEVDDYLAAKETQPGQNQSLLTSEKSLGSMSTTFFQGLGFDLPGGRDDSGSPGSGMMREMEQDYDFDK